MHNIFRHSGFFSILQAAFKRASSASSTFFHMVVIISRATGISQIRQRICDLPVARETITAMWKRVELARLALLKAACKIQERAEDAGIYASLAKNTAAEAAIFCSTEGLHLHGGYGFTTEYEISKLARDAHIVDIYEGVREVQNMIIGREIV